MGGGKLLTIAAWQQCIDLEAMGYGFETALKLWDMGLEAMGYGFAGPL